MPSIEVTRSLAVVREALERKGFEGLEVIHYDNTPSGFVMLHDDHGQLARGDRAEVERIIDGASDLDGLWSALDRVGMTKGNLVKQS